ncbi:hypothetical protein E2C01_022591 [Portunus trituberculatus]|uniref:Uncharacterized protein n=1 Tax=Portunus trituberculatus TaxID=210409 RepID=A0A5B7E5S7_PORTR|nr:hypothetical protein [Portunus trituberculatus]
MFRGGVREVEVRQEGKARERRLYLAIDPTPTGTRLFRENQSSHADAKLLIDVILVETSSGKRIHLHSQIQTRTGSVLEVTVASGQLSPSNNVYPLANFSVCFSPSSLCKSCHFDSLWTCPFFCQLYSRHTDTPSLEYAYILHLLNIPAVAYIHTLTCISLSSSGNEH